MDAATNKKLLISLIKNDLKNTRLVTGLAELGLDSGKYYLSLSEAIFILMGLEKEEQEEQLRETYSDLLGSACAIDIFRDTEKYDALADQIYMKLLQAREAGN